MKNEARNEMTGYPSIDRPWLKYYSDEAKRQRFLNVQSMIIYGKAIENIWIM